MATWAENTAVRNLEGFLIEKIAINSSRACWLSMLAKCGLVMQALAGNWILDISFDLLVTLIKSSSQIVMSD
jgi:hypothetical protein